MSTICHRSCNSRHFAKTIILWPAGFPVTPTYLQVICRLWGDYSAHAFLTVVRSNELTPGIPTEEYERRRKALMASLPADSIVVSVAAPIKYMSNSKPWDIYFSLRQVWIICLFKQIFCECQCRTRILSAIAELCQATNIVSLPTSGTSRALKNQTRLSSLASAFAQRKGYSTKVSSPLQKVIPLLEVIKRPSFVKAQMPTKLNGRGRGMEHTNPCRRFTLMATLLVLLSKMLLRSSRPMLHSP